MEQVISAVEIMGATNVKFEVGQNGVGDIIEVKSGYEFYNNQDELMFEIRNCPVIVSYKKVRA